MIIDQAALQGNFIEALELSTGFWPIMGLSSTAEISTKTQDRVAEQTLSAARGEERGTFPRCRGGAW